jgi:hypothetical protein
VPEPVDRSARYVRKGLKKIMPPFQGFRENTSISMNRDIVVYLRASSDIKAHIAECINMHITK